jgi:enolase
MIIRNIRAMEILDSRGNLTVEVRVELDGNCFGTVTDAQVLGDFQASQAAGRMVIRAKLHEGKASIIEGLL